MTGKRQHTRSTGAKILNPETHTCRYVDIRKSQISAESVLNNKCVS
jgi:hypothetical protein